MKMSQAPKWFMLELINGAVQDVPPPIREFRVISEDTQELRVIDVDTQETRVT